MEEMLKAEIPLSRPARFNGGRVGWLGSQLSKEIRRSDTAAGLAIEGMILEILSEIARREDSCDKGGKPQWLLRARDLISDRFMEPITLAEIAEEIGVHPAHLASTYRRHFGMTVGEQIRRRRIEVAKHRLENSSTPISEIALECGFSDQSHFGKVYRQLTGATSGDSRRLFVDYPKQEPTSKS
jgi:AraC family transcriptional regulator